MKSKTGSVFAAALLAAVLQPTLGHAQSAVPGLCHDGALPSGALSRICVPKTGWNGDQGHHFAAFFEYGYEHPDLGVFFAPGAFEGLEAWLKDQKLNMGDVALGMAAAQVGADLKTGVIHIGDVTSAILNEICKH